MSKPDWEAIDERAFDTIIENALGDEPIKNMPEEVTPWRKAMNRVLIGFALTAITFNFLLLDYILPTVGTVMMLQGFRTLRRENVWFKTCFNIALIRTIYLIVSIILGTTIIESRLMDSQTNLALTLLNISLILIQIICLGQAIKATQRKVELPPHAGGITAFVIWYIVICTVAVLQGGGLIIAVVMIGAYIFIIRSLFKVSRELDEAGYAINAAPVTIPDRTLSLIIISVLIIGMGFGYMFGGSYNMDWKPVKDEADAETEAIKEHLESLGFPDCVLADLTDEEIKECKDALQVVKIHRKFPVSGEVDGVYRNIAYIDRELKITGVAVELPGEREQWKIFHHFIWEKNTKFYGTESIQLWTAYRENTGWEHTGEFTGRLLYDKEGQAYTAPYDSLEEEIYTSNSFMWGQQVSNDVFATFSLPRKGENQRGYITYNIKEMQEGCIVDSWINYTHQTRWLQYPVRTAKEYRMSGAWASRTAAFDTTQDALQFFPDQEKQIVPF